MPRSLKLKVGLFWIDFVLFIDQDRANDFFLSEMTVPILLLSTLRPSVMMRMCAKGMCESEWRWMRSRVITQLQTLPAMQLPLHLLHLLLLLHLLQLHAQSTPKAVWYCACCCSVRKAAAKIINHICTPLIWSGHECFHFNPINNSHFDSGVENSFKKRRIYGLVQRQPSSAPEDQNVLWYDQVMSIQKKFHQNIKKNWSLGGPAWPDF